MASSVAYAARSSASTPLLRIWIVEDEERYRETLALLIGHTSGLEAAEVFGDAEAALALLERAEPAGRPDVVLMDVNLPGMTGVECTTRMKARAPQVPIVLLTVRDDEETIYAALSAGASGYLVKESPFDKIVLAVREAAAGGMLMPPVVARKVLGFFAATPPSDYGLTSREVEVLEQMVEGLTKKEIAEALFVSYSTINTHVQHIYEKLHVHSSSAAVAKAVRERLV